MTSPVHFIFPFLWEMSLRKNRIAWCRNVWTFRIVAYKNYFAVPATRSTFGTHQVILPVFLVNVRSLNPNRLFREVNTSIHNNFVGSGNYLVIYQIIFPNLDYTVSVVKLFSCIGSIIVHNIRFAVIIKKNTRVDTIKF